MNHGYGYDAIGNRTTSTVDAASTSYTYPNTKVDHFAISTSAFAEMRAVDGLDLQPSKHIKVVSRNGERRRIADVANEAVEL